MPESIIDDDEIIEWLRTVTGFDIKRISSKRIDENGKLAIGWRTY